MPEVSIIVPVYNAELYLVRCVDSILSQSFTDFELLLVDDGSTDGSGAICDAYAAKDSRIRALHKENGGVSSARNVGLDNANGDWIAFADADDEMLPDGLYVLVNGLSDDVDMAIGGYVIYDEEEKLIYSIDIRIEKNISSDAAAKEMFEAADYKYQGYVWNKLVRHSLVRDAGLRFAEDVVFNEDRLFMTEVICASGRNVYYTTTPVYKYFERQGSAVMSTKKGFNSKFVTDLDARIRMGKVVKSRFGNKELSALADYEVYKGYRKIVGMAQDFHLEDSQLLSRLRSQLVGAIGFRRYLQYEMRRNKRRIMNKMKFNTCS